MDNEELMKMRADDRISYLRGLVPDYDNRINQALDNIIEDGSANERIRYAFQRRVEDHFCNPGFRFGGSALDHLPQGHSLDRLTEDEIEGYFAGTIKSEDLRLSTLSQNEYRQLYAAAPGLAASILTECGFVESAERAVKLYGELRIKLDFMR
tara:strand:+ start:2281 stop:2739 length:459 start_codon:yes stop_codon:yes gene_type:complete